MIKGTLHTLKWLRAYNAVCISGRKEYLVIPSARDYCLSLHSFVFKLLNLQGLTYSVHCCCMHLHKTWSGSADKTESLQ